LGKLTEVVETKNLAALKGDLPVVVSEFTVARQTGNCSKGKLNEATWKA
jgi:hypothetical protein